MAAQSAAIHLLGLMSESALRSSPNPEEDLKALLRNAFKSS